MSFKKKENFLIWKITKKINFWVSDKIFLSLFFFKIFWISKNFSICLQFWIQNDFKFRKNKNEHMKSLAIRFKIFFFRNIEIENFNSNYLCLCRRSTIFSFLEKMGEILMVKKKIDQMYLFWYFWTPKQIIFSNVYFIYLQYW